MKNDCSHDPQARVLLVGAGGIGCELLKNLVGLGFGQVHIVDLDTIDLSNLNRQFLFRHEHIKRPKAIVRPTTRSFSLSNLTHSLLQQVAKESASRFNPNVDIQAHHANIKDPVFNVDWYQQFSVVFNALDNLEARRHVNQMCLAADVPLIESGTTGFNGQVQPIMKGRTECYDCHPKETPKTFPVCTIRSTPSQAIHCIVWAKSYLFQEIFGTSEADAEELDRSENSDNAAEIETLRREAQALKKIRESTGSEDFPRLIFDKVFTADIERLRGMEDMWKSRRKPEALDFDQLTEEALGVGAAVAGQDQKIWTRAENFAVFCTSIRRLSDRLDEQRARPDVGNAAPILSFDKDDKDTLEFVAAAANLRSSIFGIEAKSEFDIKQMAGNIIPAIATTNAMTAALSSLQAIQLLRQIFMKAEHDRNYRQSKLVFLTKPMDRVISNEPLSLPKPSCPVCGVARARIEVDLGRITLQQLVDELLKLGYDDGFAISNGTGLLYDPDFDENLPKKLSELDVSPGSFLTVADESDDPRVNLVFSVSDKTIPADQPAVKLGEKFEIARKPQALADAANGVSNGTNGNDNGNGNAKRHTKPSLKRSADQAGLEANLIAKKGKVLEDDTRSADNSIIVVEDDGAITIDD